MRRADEKLVAVVLDAAVSRPKDNSYRGWIIHDVVSSLAIRFDGLTLKDEVEVWMARPGNDWMPGRVTMRITTNVRERNIYGSRASTR